MHYYLNWMNYYAFIYFTMWHKIPWVRFPMYMSWDINIILKQTKSLIPTYMLAHAIYSSKAASAHIILYPVPPSNKSSAPWTSRRDVTLRRTTSISMRRKCKRKIHTWEQMNIVKAEEKNVGIQTIFKTQRGDKPSKTPSCE